MDKFNPQKLHTFFSPEVSKVFPIADRHYTITHSYATEDIFVDIDLKYNIKKINYTMRDDFLLSWVKSDDRYILNAYCFVGNYPYDVAKMRYIIFEENLNIPFIAIRYGDSDLFKNWPFLDDSSILVHFESTYLDLNKTENYGILKNYIL